MKAIKTTEKVLNLLLDGEFHSGEQIGAALGITRSAIWKAIQDLSKKYQIDVESVAGIGYRLLQAIELLDAHRIKAELEIPIDELIILGQIESTNDYLLSRIKSGNIGKIACFAEQQTQGKGRRGRPWISPFGHNIYHSLLWTFNKDTSEIMGLGLAIAVAVLEAIKEYGIKNGLSLKWPNDIYHEGRKLAGILLEMSAQANDACQVVVGVGINTHLPLLEATKIDQPFTSLNDTEKKPIKRNKLAGILLKHLIRALELFEKKGLEPFLIHWENYDFLKNREIHLEMSNTKITGIMRGISEKGALLLEVNGEIQNFFSGDTRVRLT